jgi:hypothetical protein
MAKRPKQPRQGARHQHRGHSTAGASPATIFRTKHLDITSRERLRKMQEPFRPKLLERDGEKVRQIEAAQSIEQVIDLVGLATGLGETAWEDRMRSFGSEVLRAIEERLRTVGQLPDPDLRDLTQERLVGELRWRGQAGARVLASSFSNLDVYGRSLASVVLGLMNLHSAADQIWEHYSEALGVRSEVLFTGALWGLLDLKDERAAGALLELFTGGRRFYEIYGFLSLAGDRRAVLPMLVEMGEVDEDERHELFMSLAGIAQRLGRVEFANEIAQLAPKDTTAQEREDMVRNFFQVTPDQVEDTFELYYRG